LPGKLDNIGCETLLVVTEEADYRHRRLLCTRRERPRGRRAA
jgi:hypothetical protein